MVCARGTILFRFQIGDIDETRNRVFVAVARIMGY